jgi:5-methylcytosine-specific restriction enzyme A
LSTNRTTPNRGWINPKRLPRGPNGRALCRCCGHEVPKGRRSFCSNACVHEHKLRSDPGYLRDQVFKRDRGVCRRCGIDTERIKRVLARLIERSNVSRGSWDWHVEHNPERYPVLQRFRLRFPWFRPWISPWAADHIVPVVEGGGECGLENIRTLCLGCHAEVTKQLRERLKRAKRKQEGLFQ